MRKREQSPTLSFVLLVLMGAGSPSISRGDSPATQASTPTPTPTSTPTAATKEKAPSTPAAAPTTTVTRNPITLGETTVHFLVHEREPGSAVIVNVHDDENTAVLAASAVLERQGGRLVEIDAQGKRMVSFQLSKQTYAFDPNRMFTDVGLDKTLKQNGRTSAQAKTQVQAFAAALLALLPPRVEGQPLIAVHNNTPGPPLTIHGYESGGAFAKEAAEVFVGPGQAEDDFFLVTERRHFEVLKSKGFNVVLQNNEGATDDGSLSVYCGKRGLPYVNVEALPTHQPQQEKMIETVVTELK
jgi:hypothetical protein